jgi:hypothetical protein
VDGFVVELGFGEEVQQLVGDGGEVVGDDEAGAGGAGGFESVDTLFDVGAGEPEGEGLEGGVVLDGDAAEGFVLGGEVVEDGGGGFGGGGEDGEGIRGIGISPSPCPFPPGRGVGVGLIGWCCVVRGDWNPPPGPLPLGGGVGAP